MIERIEDIQKIRKQLQLTQKDLAKTSGVSQSAIAKIENGTLNPSFSIVQQLIHALHTNAKKEIKTAKAIMNKNIISVKPEDNTTKIISLMQKKSISQFPVIDSNSVIGTISETCIIEALQKNHATIKDVMKEAPPIIHKDTPLSVVLDLLKYFSMIIVAEKGKNIGIITKSDALKNFK
jgi:predicted transcriptional regulator